MWRRSRSHDASAAGSLILDRLRARLPGHLRAATAATPLDPAGVDSLDLVELLCVVEEEFGVRLTQADFERARTMGDLAEGVARASRGRAGALEGGHRDLR